jgi:hypothetical protein
MPEIYCQQSVIDVKIAGTGGIPTFDAANINTTHLLKNMIRNTVI